VVIHLVPLVGRALYPLLIASQTVPTVVLAPLFVIVFGFGLVPKLAIIWLICFFPIVVNTVDGLGAVDDAYVRMMRTLHASRWAIFRRVEFPSAVPMTFTGARIGATYAAIGAVLGEWSGADNGIGYLIQQAGTSLDTPLIIAGVFVLSLLTFVLFGAVSLAERMLVPWAGES
jgi:putative hydroxymethylpyrimidine transport system permease protein